MSVAAQAGLNLNWSQTLEDTFSLDGAQLYCDINKYIQHNKNCTLSNIITE